MAITIDEVIWQRKLSRRSFVGASGVAISAMMMPHLAWSAQQQVGAKTTLTFSEIPKSNDANYSLAPGYELQQLIAWGDPLHANMKPFDVRALTADEQSKRLGYNNDYLAYVPISWGSANSEHGLLHVNHEYPNPESMFRPASIMNGNGPSAEQAAMMMQSLGFSVLEIKRTNGRWEPVLASRYNRRVTATTPITISGPAAGDARMKTAADASGKRVLGTMSNCAGGVTPWGSVLSCEENFDGYFSKPPSDGPNIAHYSRYSVNHGGDGFGWWRADERFNISKHPNESNRFGWVVEYDPYDPTSQPVKRTALGRFKHESASCVLSHDGRLAVYSGDDNMYQFIYRFVTDGIYNPRSREANRDLLDTGVLSAAKFLPSGDVQWLPLVFGNGPLVPKNGFHSQADVLIETRLAAQLMGATPMDRPEDVDVNPLSEHIFVCLTSGEQRDPSAVNAANRRNPNPYGHILELMPPAKNGKHDHAADLYRWDIFLEAGDPANPVHQAYYVHAPSEHGWLTNPDNISFDPQGRVWIATDGQSHSIGRNEAVYAAESAGDARGKTKLFLNVPAGTEATGPYFTPDGSTLFLALQQSMGSSGSGWPDFKEGVPPRSAVIAIVKKDGGVVGS
ncbi:MAG: PhoX family phosphatase [Rickettsiales bacterium]|nr:PhoX family phosphatase [Rickettsiales bacterium]